MTYKNYISELFSKDKEAYLKALRYLSDYLEYGHGLSQIDYQNITDSIIDFMSNDDLSISDFIYALDCIEFAFYRPLKYGNLFELIANRFDEFDKDKVGDALNSIAISKDRNYLYLIDKVKQKYDLDRHVNYLIKEAVEHCEKEII